MVSKSNHYQRARIKFLTKWQLSTIIQTTWIKTNRAIYNNSNSKFKKLLVVDTFIQAHRILQRCIRMILRHQIRIVANSNHSIGIRRTGNSIRVLEHTRPNKITRLIKCPWLIFKSYHTIREISWWISIITKPSRIQICNLCLGINITRVRNKMGIDKDHRRMLESSLRARKAINRWH